MSMDAILLERAENACELCAASEGLRSYSVPELTSDPHIIICQNCHNQLTETLPLEADHWQCLATSMWSTVPAVQVVARRILSFFVQESWAKDLLDMLYLDDEMIAIADARPFAKAGPETKTPKTFDSNGTELQNGDTVTLIKDLAVKGAGFTAKRGTAVRNISLTDNPKHIEGRVNGQTIVLVSAYLKKSV